MKLHELDALKQQDKAAQVLEQRLGQSVSFNNLTLRESRHMLMRVRGLINEHRASVASHSSERDPAYLKLLMLESGLKGRLKEGSPPMVLPSDEKYTQALARVYGQAILKNSKFPDLLARLKRATPNERDLDVVIKTGTLPNHLEEVAPAMLGQPAAGAVPIDTKDPKVQAAMKKSQSGQTLNPEEQKLVGAVAASAMQKESLQARRRLRESEIQQAQVVLAAQDMVDQVQKMLEQISAMQFKDLPALTDSIKNDMGVDQATAYQSAAAAALTQLLQSVQTGKTALEGAQGTLTGQAPVVPGEEPAADMGADLNAEPAPEMGAELGVDAEVAPAGDDEEPTPLGAPEALGRERRVAEGQLDELSPQTLRSYQKKRGGELGSFKYGSKTQSMTGRDQKNAVVGLKRATKNLNKSTDNGEMNEVAFAEAAKKGKPDFLDLDKDGNKKESMKKAAADKKKNPFAKAK
jgi:hypothetical protein